MKLISTPYECGHHPNYSTSTGFRRVKLCLKNSIECNNLFKFPIDCPLQNGQPIPKSTEELIEIVKSETIKLKRRNRKNCKHYENTEGNVNGCSAPWKRSVNCTSVNCGHFKEETEISLRCMEL